MRGTAVDSMFACSDESWDAAHATLRLLLLVLSLSGRTCVLRSGSGVLMEFPQACSRCSTPCVRGTDGRTDGGRGRRSRADIHVAVKVTKEHTKIV